MAAGYVQLPSDASNTGKKVRTNTRTIGSDSVHEHFNIIQSGDGNDNQAIVTASNALKVDNSAVTQPVSAASLPLPTGAATSAKQDAILAELQLKADLTETQPVSIATMPTTPVTGTFWQATQPVSAASLPLPTGASTAAKQPALGTAGTASADVITVQGIASMTALRVDGSAVTQPVSGTVTATGPLTDTELRASAVPVSLASVPSHAVTNAGTFAVQESGAALTSLQLIDDAVSTTGSAITAKGLTACGTDGTNARALKTDTSGELQVDVLTLPNVTIGAAIPAGTNNIGDVDVLSIAAGDNNIGNVDVVTMPNVTLAAGTNTNEVVGDVAQDAAAAGNPVLVAASSETMADSAPANRVSADADCTRLSATDGALFVIPTGPQTWSYHSDGSSALTDASVHAAPGAGLSLYVTDIVCSTGAATAMNIFFEEGSTKVLGPYYLEAVAGRGVAIHFGTPKKITANTALTVTTSQAIAQSVDVQGFVATG